MSDVLRTRLSTLRAVAPRLNAVSDEVSEIVAKVEKTLAEELSIGISDASDAFASWPACADDDAPEPGDSFVFQSLAFGRVGGTYRIHVLQQTCDKDERGGYSEMTTQKRIPWGSCPRETKLQAFTKLPKLLDAIISKAEKLVKAADGAANQVKEMTEGIVDQEDGPVTVPCEFGEAPLSSKGRIEVCGGALDENGQEFVRLLVEVAHFDPATFTDEQAAGLVYEAKTTIYLTPAAARKVSMAMMY
jgi:hypothetical protein